MKKRLALTLLLIINSIIAINAQETDSLWNSFLQNLGETIETKLKNEARYNVRKITDTFINTDIEEKALDYIADNCTKDSLLEIVGISRDAFKNVGARSESIMCRKKAIHYYLDISLDPALRGFFLSDFDESIKQRVIDRFFRRYTDEEVNHYAALELNYQIRKRQSHIRYKIDQYISKQKKTNGNELSFVEAQELVYQEIILEERENILNRPLGLRNIINIGQLNIEEMIPLLKEYAEDEKADSRQKEYAIYALAILRIDNYEDKATFYFDIDTYSLDTELAEVMNSQKVWYAYTTRLKSEKYRRYCPVAYFTIQDLYEVLKKFLENEDENSEEPFIPFHLYPIVPAECGWSFQTERTPINPDCISLVLDWMEKNKGKYEILHPKVRAY